MFHAFVTISGEFPDTTWDYLDILLERYFDSFEDAVRWYQHLWVKPFGTFAMTVHAMHPELTQIEAEYDIYEQVGDGWEPVGDLDWFSNEAIWWEE